jgi:hypothetical protein
MQRAAPLSQTKPPAHCIVEVHWRWQVPSTFEHM